MYKILAVVAIVVLAFVLAYLPTMLARPTTFEVPGYPSVVCVRYITAISCVEVTSGR